MTDGPRGECQNHKSNLSLTPSSYKVYLHFHIASTSKTSMFRHFKTGWHVHILCHWALTKDRELGPVHPTLIWLSNHILPFDDASKGIPKDPLFIASFYLSGSSLYSLVATLDLEAFRTLCLISCCRLISFFLHWFKMPFKDYIWLSNSVSQFKQFFKRKNKSASYSPSSVLSKRSEFNFAQKLLNCT